MRNQPNAHLWHQLAEERMPGMPAWRQEHPTATLRAMENELDARWAKVRARMLHDMAVQRVATAWKQPPPPRIRPVLTGAPPWKSAVPTPAIANPTAGRPSPSMTHWRCSRAA